MAVLTEREIILNRILPERGVAINKICEKRAVYIWIQNGVCQEKDCYMENCSKKPKK